MNRKWIGVAIAIILGTPGPAPAQTPAGPVVASRQIVHPPEDDAAVTVLSLRETAETRVAPDQLIAVLRAEATGGSPAAVQKAVNERMAKALADIRSVSQVKAGTGGYSVTSWRGDAGPLTWRAVQNVSITAPSPAAFSDLLGLLGRLQDTGTGLALGSLDFGVSAPLRSQAQQDLVTEAISRVLAQADSAAGALGATVAGVRTIRVDKSSSSWGGQVPMMAAHKAVTVPAAAVPPAVEAGEHVLQVTVEAEVVLIRTGSR